MNEQINNKPDFAPERGGPGSLRPAKKRKSRAVDLTGKQFGKLTVLERAPNKPGGNTKWICQCECGRRCTVTSYKLIHGIQYCCGCETKSHPKDITGQKFRMLTALYPTDRRDYKGGVIWHCRCDCGNELDVSYNNLKFGEMVSCGCRKKETSRQLVNYIDYVAGTAASRLVNREPTVRSRTGVRGVFMSRGRYVAVISIQGKSYYLGSYTDLETAKEVRKEAEHAVFDEFLDYFKEWKEKDPEWKRNNPIELHVEKDDSNRFRITVGPDLSDTGEKKQQPVRKARRNKGIQTRGEETLVWEG